MSKNLDYSPGNGSIVCQPATLSRIFKSSFARHPLVVRSSFA